MNKRSSRHIKEQEQRRRTLSISKTTWADCMEIRERGLRLPAQGESSAHLSC